MTALQRSADFQMSGPIAHHRPFRRTEPRENCAMGVSLAWETWKCLADGGFYEFIPCESPWSFVQQKERLLVLLEEDLQLTPEPRVPTSGIERLLGIELDRRGRGWGRPYGFGSRSSVTVSYAVRERLVSRCGPFRFSEHVAILLLEPIDKAGLLEAPKERPPKGQRRRWDRTRIFP